MQGYYSQKLSAERLRRCYEIAPPRVQRYLDAEIDFVLERTAPSNVVLEFGCGYGRVLERLASKAKTIIGIDTAPDSLRLALGLVGNIPGCHIIGMDAIELGFRDRAFDLAVCIQNGISAFKVDQRKLINEAIRVTRFGGMALFSSYSERFWEDRLEWFQLQADHGLIGEIDYDATGDGVIVCKDGFRACTLSCEDFTSLVSGFECTAEIIEVDDSSIFCVMHIE